MKEEHENSLYYRKKIEEDYESLCSEMDEKINTFDKAADVMKNEQAKLNSMCELLIKEKEDEQNKNNDLNSKIEDIRSEEIKKRNLLEIKIDELQKRLINLEDEKINLDNKLKDSESQKLKNE